jgi:uncharacterized protein YlxW (UPF0749 family)
VLRRPNVAIAALVGGFMIVLEIRNAPPNAPLTRGPAQDRLADLIRDEQRRSDRLRQQAEQLRARVRAIQQAGAGRQATLARASSALDTVRVQAGIVAVRGPALLVSLSDSTERDSPSGNLNDLVIHSQDVQAVANGLWSAGADAVSVDGERVVPTSALLCVGNVLLINGTVHSPPYKFIAIGNPDELRRRFQNDILVARLRTDADRFKLGFAVTSTDDATVPAYTGSTELKFARRVS